MRKLAMITGAVAALFACGGADPAPTAEPEMAAKEAPAPAEEAPAAAEEAPAEEAPAGDDAFASLDEAGKVAALMELGKTVYETGGSGGVACQTCHQANGEGLPGAFPPLKGAKDWMKDCGTHAGYVINGLKGEIEVAGAKYNGVMPAQANLSDLEIAAAITYERMSWGNDYGPCMPEAVAAAR